MSAISLKRRMFAHRDTYKSVKSKASNCGQLSQSVNISWVSKPSQPPYEVVAGIPLLLVGVGSCLLLSEALRLWLKMTVLLKLCIMPCKFLISFAVAVKRQPLSCASSVPTVQLILSRRRSHSRNSIICTSTRSCKPPVTTSD